MWDVVSAIAVLGWVCWGVWRWLLRPLRDWLDYRDKLTLLHAEVEQLRTGERGDDDGDRV